MMTKSEFYDAWESFFNEIKPAWIKEHGRMTLTDYRSLFCEFIDMMNKDGLISDEMAECELY